MSSPSSQLARPAATGRRLAPPESDGSCADELRQLVRNAWERVPFYATHWESIATQLPLFEFPRDLPLLPVVRKSDLLACSPSDWLDRSYLDRRLSSESTSGSSGQPITIQRDSATLRRRRLRFLRALLACGYRPGQRVMAISTRRNAGWMSLARWHYVDLSSEELLRQYQELRPTVLYGPLSSLLEIARQRTGSLHRPCVVISTAEQISPSQLEFLRDAYGVDAADFYGMTELGLVAFRRPAGTRYEIADDSLCMEFLPSGVNSDAERLVVTDLIGGATPLVRYDTGDLVQRDQAVACRPIVAFVGRRVDSLLLPSGRNISPYQVTMRLERIEGVRQYEVIQRRDLSIDVSLQVDPAVANSAVRVEQELAQLCEASVGIRVSAQAHALESVPGKFRPVRSEASAAP